MLWMILSVVTGGLAAVRMYREMESIPMDLIILASTIGCMLLVPDFSLGVGFALIAVYQVKRLLDDMEL